MQGRQAAPLLLLFAVIGVVVPRGRAAPVSGTNSSSSHRDAAALHRAAAANGSALVLGRRLQMTAGRHSGRGGRGIRRGGRGAAGAAAAAPWTEIPTGRAPPGERVCYPLAPNERRELQGQVREGTSFGAAPR